MRILHLANHCHEIGNGIMNVAVDLACEQAAMGHSVAFASAGGSFTPLLNRSGVKHHTVCQHWRRPVSALSSPIRLHQVIQAFRPDVIHAHMVAGALLARALALFNNCGLVTTVHNAWQQSATLMGVGERVIAVSAAVAAEMAERGIPASKLKVVLNGPLGTPRQSYSYIGPPVELHRPAIVTLCGLYERKGVADLIAAFEIVGRSFPKAFLYVVGDGPDRNRFAEQAARSLVADRIVFAGFQRDPRAYLSQADIFVLASRDEPFGLVLAEARNAGCAVVGTAVGGIPEVLEHGSAGILTQPRQPNHLAVVLERLLGDPQELADWKRRATQGLDRLTTARMARNTLTVYDELVATRREKEVIQPSVKFKNSHSVED